MPPPEAPRPPLGYLPAGFAHRPAKPRTPPENSSVAPAPPAAPAENAMPLPATAPANQQLESAPLRRRSPRLNPVQGHAHAIISSPVTPPHHSPKNTKMARTFPLTVSFNECLSSKSNPLSFTNLTIMDLRNGHSQYLSTIKQLVDALPKTLDPASRFALQGQIARPGQKCLRHSMRAAIWFLLPSDGTFRHSSTSLRYFLTRQGWGVILRGGDVTLPPWERYLNWVPDIAPPPSRDHDQKDIPPPPRDHGKKDPPSPSRDHGKENFPPHKLPRKIRPRRRRETHHIPGSSQTESQPATSGSPGSVMHAPVKHPLTSQRPQHPQPPSPAANHNSRRSHLQDHPESGWVYKPASSSIQQDSTTRSRRDSFSGSGLSSPALQRSH